MLVACLPLFLCAVTPAAEGATQGGNVVFVTIDGLRTREMFGGAEEALIQNRLGGVRDAKGLRQRFWRDSAEARREALLPFLWTVMARRGQVFGDAATGCPARVLNAARDSKAGYGEMFRGYLVEGAALDATGNEAPGNVLEWLNRRPAFKGRVSIFVGWEPLARLLDPRGELKAFGGWRAFPDQADAGPRQAHLAEALPNLPRIWPEATYDVVLMQLAMDHLRLRKPRVLYIGFNETDEWAHDRRYDLYLEAAYNCDQFIARLWVALQSMPEYAGKTTLVVAADHGRGRTLADWTGHGRDIAGADEVWVAAMGPAVPPLGVRRDGPVTMAQIAATLAALAGEDYPAAEPRSGPALPIAGRK